MSPTTQDPGPRFEINIHVGHGSSFDSAQDRELAERWDLGRWYQKQEEHIAGNMVKLINTGIG